MDKQEFKHLHRLRREFCRYAIEVGLDSELTPHLLRWFGAEYAPQGLGFLDFTPAPLTDDEAKAIIRKDDRFGPVNLDYVKGRAVKFAVMRRGDRLFVRSQWFDHSPSQLLRVLAKVGITTEPTAA